LQRGIIHFLRGIYLKIRTQDLLLFSVLLIWKSGLRRKKVIVVRRMVAIGDIICTLPLCEHLRKENPDKLIVFMTGHSVHRLVKMSTSCDLVYGACGGDFTVPVGFLGLVEKVYHPSTSDELGLNGAKKHLIDDLAASCGVTLEIRQPWLYPSKKDLSSAQTRYGLHKRDGRDELLICINTGPTWPVRNWSDEKWQQLVDKIHHHYKAEVVEIGYHTPESKPLHGVRSLIGIGSVTDMVSMISLCDLVVTIDSGPIHIAGAVGTPVIGLFGAVNPAFRLPPEGNALGLTSDIPCLYCHHESPVGHWRSGCPYDIRCMEELSVEQVTRAVQGMIDSTSPSYFAA